MKLFLSTEYTGITYLWFTYKMNPDYNFISIDDCLYEYNHLNAAVTLDYPIKL